MMTYIKTEIDRRNFLLTSLSGLTVPFIGLLPKVDPDKLAFESQEVRRQELAIKWKPVLDKVSSKMPLDMAVLLESAYVSIKRMQESERLIGGLKAFKFTQIVANFERHFVENQDWLQIYAVPERDYIYQSSDGYGRASVDSRCLKTSIHLDACQDLVLYHNIVPITELCLFYTFEVFSEIIRHIYSLIKKGAKQKRYNYAYLSDLNQQQDIVVFTGNQALCHVENFCSMEKTQIVDRYGRAIRVVYSPFFGNDLVVTKRNVRLFPHNVFDVQEAVLDEVAFCIRNPVFAHFQVMADLENSVVLEFK